jgi:hypothetical protein
MNNSLPMEAKGIRLPPGLWLLIDSEAATLRMTRSEWLRRRIEGFFSLAEGEHTMRSQLLNTLADRELALERDGVPA